jgi:FkbM family methyltransferase
VHLKQYFCASKKSTDVNIKQLRELAAKYPLLRIMLYPAIIARRPFVKARDAWKAEVIENLGQLLVTDPVMKVDEFGGVFSIDARSDLFARVIINKEYEPRFISYVLNNLDKKRDVIDVGANVGFYTVLFAKHLEQGRVVAVEPTRNALRNLHKNIELNKVGSKVEVFQGVVSDRSGELEIKTILGKEEYSSLGVMDHPSIAKVEHHIEKVASTTLDELVAQRNLNPGFIKIDVEGAENLVFKGAIKVLKEKRPVIMSEISDFLLRSNGSSAQEVFKLIESCDYVIQDIGNPGGHLMKHEFEHILCIPKERANGRKQV